MIYKQCVLRKKNKVDIAWIPAVYAITNKFLRINNDNGWLVEKVYNTELEYDKLNLDSRDYTKMRVYSDI